MNLLELLLFGGVSYVIGLISVEIAGFASEGPTRAQAESMLRLFDDVNARYGPVVPLAHRDFQRVKPCPGRTQLIKAAFGWMGGHGKDYREERSMSTGTFESDQVCDVEAGARLFDWPGGPDIGTVTAPLTRDYLGGRTVNGDGYVLISSVLDGKPRTAWVAGPRIKNVRSKPSTTDCGDAVSAEHQRVKQAVIAAVSAL